MTVVVRPAIDTTPPPLGGDRWWMPDDMAEHVFSPPERRGDGVVSASQVSEYWDRAVEEVRLLHEVVSEQATRISELESGDAGAFKQSAIAEIEHMKRRARAEINQHLGVAHQKAEQIQAEALERIAAAERNATPAPPKLAKLPPLDAADLGGSLARRHEYAQSLMDEVRADAMTMASASASVLGKIDGTNTTSSVPVTWSTVYDSSGAVLGQGASKFDALADAGQTIVKLHTGEPDDTGNAEPEVAVTTGDFDPELDGLGGLESVVNHSDRTVPFDDAGRTLLVEPGDTLHARPEAITAEFRAQMSGHPADERRAVEPGEPAARIDRDYPEHGLKIGDVIPRDYVPDGVVFEDVLPGEPDPYDSDDDYAPDDANLTDD